MTLRINPSNKRKIVANAVSKLLDENRQKKHITIEGEERDFNGKGPTTNPTNQGTAHSSGKDMIANGCDDSVMGGNQNHLLINFRNNSLQHPIERISERSKE